MATIYGETDAGWRRKTFEEIGSSIRLKMRKRIDERLSLDSLDWVGNTVDVFSDELDLAWQALEEARNGFDPANAKSFLMKALAALTGTQAEEAKVGVVPCTLGLAGSKSFAARELVAHEKGNPLNRWVNTYPVVSTTPGDYSGIQFESETAGPYTVLAGTLTVIAQTKNGWLTITNPTDATPGSAEEDIDDLRIRREEDLATAASSSEAGLFSAVQDIKEVVDNLVRYNDTDTDTDELPKHSVRVIVWDNVTEDADDDTIAQTIFDTKSGGATTVGALSGTAIDPNGKPRTVYFDRATQVQVYVDATVKVTADAGDDEVLKTAIKAAFVARNAEKVGAELVALTVKAAPVPVRGVDNPTAVDGVLDVTAFTMGLSASPTATGNIQPDFDAVLVLDSGNINVTIVRQAVS